MNIFVHDLQAGLYFGSFPVDIWQYLLQQLLVQGIGCVCFSIQFVLATVVLQTSFGVNACTLLFFGQKTCRRQQEPDAGQTRNRAATETASYQKSCIFGVFDHQNVIEIYENLNYRFLTNTFIITEVIGWIIFVCGKAIVWIFFEYFFCIAKEKHMRMCNKRYRTQYFNINWGLTPV